MTIGFGDFVPGNSYIYNKADNMSEKEAHAKLVLLAIYLLLGMAIIGMCLNLMQEKIQTQVGHIVCLNTRKRLNNSGTPPGANIGLS